MARKKKKKNIFSRIKEFFEDVKKETTKVNWTSKENLIKYSVATLMFIMFICLFFMATDLLIALISYIKELIG